MGKHITDYLLYRWRYILGYVLIGILIVGLIALAGLYVPGGISSSEMNSVVTSNALSFSLGSFDPSSVINLPYHLLQRVSLDLFGVTTLSIKLPSLILGIISAFGMALLLKRWFRPNIALLTLILVITTGQFLFIAQSGSPSIMYGVTSIWLLVAALMISRRAKNTWLWKIAFFAIAAVSLYTSLSAYILVALFSAAMLHPHLRYLIRRLSKAKLAVAVFLALIILAPLVYAIVREPSVGLTLLGIPSTPPDLIANTVQLLKQYFDFAAPTTGTLMTPIYGFGSMVLIILGVLRLVTTKYTARSYIITAWIILLLPVLIVNPNYVSVTFVPVLLLMGMGITILLSRWYGLFPRNPYARFAGLLPLIVLIGGMVFSGIDRYVYGYLYDPQTANYFSKDLQLVNNELKTTQGEKLLLVDESEVPFYAVVAHHTQHVVVDTQVNPASADSTVIISHQAYSHGNYSVPNTILTDGRSQDADRFYIYKTK